MIETQAGVRPATTARLIHASLIAGVVIFGVLTYFVIRPAQPEKALPPTVHSVLLALSLTASAIAFFVMRGKIPRRSSDVSPDLYWTSAYSAAMMTWAPLEAGGLLGIVAYMLYGSALSLTVAGIAVAGMIVLNPGRLERVDN